MRKARQQGFTLIELSIVLVIIGLIVGGVLVGQDLIRAAQVRATISQIEKYNTAVDTFREKYGYLPGDIKDPDATNFGFKPRGQYAGEGDGNGIIEAITANGPSSNSGVGTAGETIMFWADLSKAGLTEGSFTLATPTVIPGWPYLFDSYFPTARLGSGNSVSVWSGGPSGDDGNNYFTLSVISAFTNVLYTAPGLTVQQAYSIDKKMDDGMPQTGWVGAFYVNQMITNDLPVWAAGGGVAGTGPGIAATGSGTACFDNGGNAANPMQYSLTQNGGAGVNCALSFRFQ